MTAFDDLVAVAHEGTVTIWRVSEDSEIAEELVVVKATESNIIGVDCGGARSVVSSTLCLSYYDLFERTCTPPAVWKRNVVWCRLTNEKQ